MNLILRCVSDLDMGKIENENLDYERVRLVRC